MGDRGTPAALTGRGMNAWHSVRQASRRRKAAAAIALCALAAAAAAFRALLPERLFDAPLSHVLEARDGTLLGARIASDGQWRFPLQASVPGKFRRAVLVFEDKRFERHSGIDGLAIARAARLNLKAGHVVSGGSTLTMQPGARGGCPVRNKPHTKASGDQRRTTRSPLPRTTTACQATNGCCVSA